MGLTFRLGQIPLGVFTDASNNVGIGASPSGTYKFEVTGTAKVSGILTLGSTISNGTYAYTLPSATGTLALTSALGDYLPLAGGTLTGALGGTSASFSSSVTAGGYITGQGSNPGGLGGSRFVLDWLSGQMRVFSYGANTSTNGGFVFNSQRSDGTNSINYLDIASTGAATFSSSVTANILNSTSTGSTQIFLKSTGGGANRDWQFQTNETAAGDISLMQSTTAGGATYATKVNISPTGNVGIGTSSTGFNPAGLPLVVGSGSGNTGMTIFSGASYSGSIHFADAETTGAGSYAGFINYDHTTNSMQFGTTGAAPAEAMRITSGGNVGIGTSSPVANDGTSKTFQIGSRLTIQNVVGTQFLLGTNVYYDGGWKYIAAAKAQAVRGTGESGAIQFSLSPTGTAGGSVPNMDGSDVKMIILESGNVGIGTISPSRILSISQANPYISLTSTANSREFLTGVDSSGYVVYDATSGGYRMSIDFSGNFKINSLGTGTVTATSGTLSTVSDMNLKIEDGFIDNALDKVLKLKPRYYHWKEESGLPTDLRQLGFYAQEVNEALGEEAANTPKTENDKWGIYDRGMIAFLTAAIQEQQKQIEELKLKIK